MTKLYEWKLKDGRKWLAGTKTISIADFTVGAAYFCTVRNPNIKHEALRKAMARIADSFPLVKKWLDRFAKEMGPYLKSRPPAPL